MTTAASPHLTATSPTFLSGPAGTGKTTQAIDHLRRLLVDGVRPENILILVPQRSLGRPYQKAMAAPDWPDAAGVDVVTIGGLAKRGIELYWPLVAEEAGFTNAFGNEPTFLTIETAQYYMARFIDQAIDKGLFDSISVPRARLIAQSLDNLSKAAINAFSLTEVAERLASAWAGHSSRLAVYQTWLGVAQDFRRHCLEHNLLDFSLQIEVFADYLMQHPTYIDYVLGKYRHLIADNIEEQQPVALEFIRWLLPNLDSTLLVYDEDAGYRIFLGADPNAAQDLRAACQVTHTAEAPHTQSGDMLALEAAIDSAFTIREGPEDEPEPITTETGQPLAAFTAHFTTFYPQMLDWACAQVIDLIHSGQAEPRDVVILAPFLTDSLRFTVMNTLEEAGIPYVSHRPSRAIRDEPAARALLTAMQLVNPAEDSNPPPPDDVQDMLVALIDGLDPIRAALLTRIVYGVGRQELGAFDDIVPHMQTRITYRLGERYEQLRQWLAEQRATVGETPPDYFLRRLFGDVAAQPGFGLHTDLHAGTVVAQLVDSAFDFRQALYPEGTADWSMVWVRYRELVSAGLLAAVHAQSWHKEEANAVFIAPAYTFLVRNRPVKYQVWLDIGSHAWWERLDQPLTHPYVVRRDWEVGHLWTDQNENDTRWAMLRKIMLGLTRRCQQQVYLATADLGEQGFEQRGPMLRIFQQILELYG